MFPTRSLLNHVECPDHQSASCHRPSCPFSHSISKRKVDNEEEEEIISEIPAEKASIKRRAGIEVKSVPSISGRKSENVELNALLSALSKGPKNTHAAKKEQAQASTSSQTATPSRSMPAKVSPSPLSSTSQPEKQARPFHTNTPSTSSVTSSISNGISMQAPTISRTSHPGTSPVPYASRQSSLQTLFTTFHLLYSSLIQREAKPNQSTSTLETESKGLIHKVITRVTHILAFRHSEATEAKTFKTSNVNFLAYRNNIRTNLVSLSRRQKVDKEAEEKGERECISMLGVEVSKKALELYDRFDPKEMGKEQQMRKLEEEVIALLGKSTLIGTSEEVDQKKKEEEERVKGTMDRGKMEAANLLTNKTVLKAVGFPHPDVEREEDVQTLMLEKWGEGGRQQTREGETVDCDRCGTSFTISSPALDEGDDAVDHPCSFHWGKRRFVREMNVAKGPRLPRWTCCDALDEASTFASSSLSQIASSAGLISSSNGQASVTKGCSQGPHVFKEEGAEVLHQREGFLDTAQVFAELEQEGRLNKVKTHDVLAFDCELVYTTAGMSLARLTVLDESGAVILDQFVKPRAPVLDYNTRFSGIKSSDLLEGDSAVDLAEARRRMVALMNPLTILVGHGLENDLKAIRLIHMQIADSALLYEHHKGLPFRFGLRDLTLKHLGRHIQGGDATVGHDAEEDARAALDLVRKKYLDFVEGRQSIAQQEELKTEAKETDPRAGDMVASPIASSHSSTTRVVADGPSAKAKASLFIKKRDPKKRKI